MKSSRRDLLKQTIGGMFAWTTLSAFSAQSSSARAQVDERDQGFEAEFPSMGSVINLRWYAKVASQDRVVESAKSVADFWVSVLSDYDPSSQSMQVCAQADSGKWVSVSDDLWKILEECDRWNRWSEGAFDASLGALTRIRRQRKLASPEQWAQARSKCGWRLIELEQKQRLIRFLVSGVRLDFGAIGKGFVVDRIADKLIEMGIERFVVNASGNMRVGLPPLDKAGWPIAIDVPVSTADSNSPEPFNLMQLRVSKGGIATSGDKWQRFPDAPNIESRDRTSHIVDPATGVGLTGHQSVTILADNAADADAAATATCVRARRDLAGWLETMSKHKPNLRAIVMMQESDAEPMRLVSTNPLLAVGR